MQDIINENSTRVCQNCGSVHGYDDVNQNIDFYEDMYKIRRKSVYHRKYDIENVIVNITGRIQITRDEINRICRIFEEIDKILPQVNNGRKRMISVKYILKQLFKMMGLPYRTIQISKSKRTLTFYERYWTDILSLIGDRIDYIIQ